MDTKGKRKSYSEILNLFDKQESAKFDQERKEANQKLVDILQDLINKNPTQRFSQILRNYGFVRETRPVSPSPKNTVFVGWENEFYAEPQAVLKRVEQRIKNDEDSKA